LIFDFKKKSPFFHTFRIISNTYLDMRGGEKLFSPDRKRILDKWESSFWTEYANIETRKYEIPLVYDKSFGIFY
jgi:hypothetical protein